MNPQKPVLPFFRIPNRKPAKGGTSLGDAPK
jgi:hypothetical protein